MAISASSSAKGIVVKVPLLILSAAAAAIFLFFLFSPPSSFSCSCPTDSSALAGAGAGAGATAGATASGGGIGYGRVGERISATADDIEWLKGQIDANGLHMQQNVLRKGINPRTRSQQLQDLIQLALQFSPYDASVCVGDLCSISSDFISDWRFKGISHYEGDESNNHTGLPCPGELLVEEHHSNYGEPWAGGRDVFEFLADSVHLAPNSRVLEIGCGTLRVGLHFIRYLYPQHYHCLERDELSLMAAYRYEIPSQGLLQKRPLIVKGDDMDFSKFGSGIVYDLIYASAVFLHMPDKLVWVGLERLVNKLKPFEGRIFVSHNIKFCSRLGGEECTKKLDNLGLEYVQKHTHDSLLFNHYEIWFEFRRIKA